MSACALPSVTGTLLIVTPYWSVVPYWNVVVAFVSSVPLSVAELVVTLVASPVTGAASATTVARRAIIASIEHCATREDAVFMSLEPLPFERRLGAFPLGDGHAGFRVWAPAP